MLYTWLDAELLGFSEKNNHENVLQGDYFILAIIETS